MEKPRDPSGEDDTPPLPEFDGIARQSIERPNGTASSASKRREGGLHNPADMGDRFIAMFIDIGITFVMGIIPLIGGLMGTAYMLCRDGLTFEFMDRRSIGKRAMGLRPVRLDGQPMDVETSFLRNWMFGLGALVLMVAWIPVLGWVAATMLVPLSILIALYEIYLVLSDENGRRWGDHLGDTQVIKADG